MSLFSVAKFSFERLLERTANDFKPDAAAIEDAPVPLSAHAALYVTLLLLVSAILWSIFGAVDRIVVATGKIATRTPMVVMQPFSTSRIVDLAVKAGDHVVKGQVLVRFDPSFAQADVSSMQQKAASLSVQIQRIEAQLTNAKFTTNSSDGSERSTQAQIYVHEMSDYEAELKQRDNRLAQIDAQVQVDENAIPGISRQVDMAQKVVEMQDRLRQQNAAAPLDVMKAQSGLIDVQLRLKNTQGDYQKLVQQKAEALHERQAFMDKWRSDHNQQLVTARRDLSDATETLSKATRMHDLTELEAPVNGVVQQVADRSVGSVLREAETLVTIVPDAASLYVEANVPSRDIGYLKIGDRVRIKLESYPFQRFGTLAGELVVLSPDSMPLKDNADQSQMIYRAQIRLDESPQAVAARRIFLRPGLAARAEIKTGRQSIASYILNPILRIEDESLHEP